MNITDSDVESGSPAPTTDDSESPAGTSTTSRAPNISSIPTDQPAVPSQSRTNGAGDGPSQYQTLVGRAPSNPASTAMMQQSSTLAHRQVPSVPGMGGMTMTPEMLTSELNRIAPSTLANLKQELGMPDKDLTIMTPEEKVRNNDHARVAALTYVDARRCSLCSCSVEGPPRDHRTSRSRARAACRPRRR